MQLRMSKNYPIVRFLLEDMKIIISFTRFFSTDMYKSPLYGKEWNWRNIKMETRELHMVLRP